MEFKNSDRKKRSKDIMELTGKEFKRVMKDSDIQLMTNLTGFLLSINNPILGFFTSQIMCFILRNFKNIISGGELFEAVKGIRREKEYSSVGQFWTEIENDKLEHGTLIEITGLLSPYAPLVPSHPLSRPGYTVEGWESMGDLDTKDTEDYDLQDSLLYGDRIIKLPVSPSKKYYAGLYDYNYGLSNVGLPLYVDTTFTSTKKYGLDTLWKYHYSIGRFVKIKGNLIKLENPYKNFAKQLPKDCIKRQNFGLEVTDMILSENPKGVTHISASVVWFDKEKNEKMLAHYFNVQNLKQLKLADFLLQEERDSNIKNLAFDYDDLKYLHPKYIKVIPKYNEMLRDWFAEK